MLASIDDLICSNSIKQSLKSLFNSSLVNNPRQLYEAVEECLEGQKWEWPWLDQYPDTLGYKDSYPDDLNKARCQLLADTFMRSDTMATRIEQWKVLKSGRLPYYCMVSAIIDYRVLPECKAADKTFITLDQPDIQKLLPLHRPGCRCTIIVMNERQRLRYVS